jgi:uncharacterized YigZ family protein
LHEPVFSYKTISGPSTGSYREKGSKFLAFAFPVADEGEIRGHLERLRKEYFDARHHGYAWVLGADKNKFRANDDGEPGHSAGDPILGQIRSKDLTNVLMVVVRYFGGTKLGVGGLIHAYRTAALDALSQAEIVVKEVMAELTIDYDYSCSPDLMRLVKEFDLNILDQQFEERGMMRLAVRSVDKEQLIAKLQLMQAMKYDIRFEIVG